MACSWDGEQWRGCKLSWEALEDLMGEDEAEGEDEASQQQAPWQGWGERRQGGSSSSSSSSTQRCACPHNLVQGQSAELISRAASHLTLLKSPQGKHCLKIPKVCRRKSKGPRMGRGTLGSTWCEPYDPIICWPAAFLDANSICSGNKYLWKTKLP